MSNYLLDEMRERQKRIDEEMKKKLAKPATKPIRNYGVENDGETGIINKDRREDEADRRVYNRSDEIQLAVERRSNKDRRSEIKK